MKKIKSIQRFSILKIGKMFLVEDERRSGRERYVDSFKTRNEAEKFIKKVGK